MKILIDMNLTPRWVERLRHAGHEAVHWSSIGKAEAPDQEICDYARLHEYVLLTMISTFHEFSLIQGRTSRVSSFCEVNRWFRRPAAPRSPFASRSAKPI